MLTKEKVAWNIRTPLGIDCSFEKRQQADAEERAGGLTVS